MQLLWNLCKEKKTIVGAMVACVQWKNTASVGCEAKISSLDDSEDFESHKLRRESRPHNN